MSYEMTDGDMPPVAPETTQRPQVQDGAIVTVTTSFSGKVYLLQNGMKIARRRDGEGLKLDHCRAFPQHTDIWIPGSERRNRHGPAIQWLLSFAYGSEHLQGSLGEWDRDIVGPQA